MVEIVALIDKIKHEQLRPLKQSLKAHIELSYNTQLHISSSVLKDLARRVQEIEDSLLTLLNGG